MYIYCTNTVRIIYPYKIVHNMASISYTKIKSVSKKLKGQWYPKFYINSPNWNNPKRPRYKDILFYYRADTNEKKKQNLHNQKLLDAVHQQLEEQYKGAEYTDSLESSTTLKKHLVHMIDVKRGKSEATVRTFMNLKTALETFCIVKGHNIIMDINRVNLKFVDEFRTWLVNDARTKTGKSYKGNTSYKYFSSLGTALKKAKQYRQLFHNPFDEDIEYPKKSDTEMVFLTHDEVLVLRKSLTDFEMIKNAFLFMCYTGIRQGDCRNLKWGDLPIINGETKMNVKTQKAKTDIHFKIRWVTQSLLPKRMGDSDKVFPNLTFSNKNNHKLREWVMMTGIQKHITPHTARHTFSAYMLSKGTPLYTLSKLLGHTNARTTEERYGHLSNEDIEEAMKKVWGD